MKKFTILSSLLVCGLFSIADCSEANDRHPTETICWKETFYFEDKSHDYESPLVNTFYRLEAFKDLHRFKSYLIEYDSDFLEFLSSNNGKKLLEFTEKHNKVGVNQVIIT